MTGYLLNDPCSRTSCLSFLFSLDLHVCCQTCSDWTDGPVPSETKPLISQKVLLQTCWSNGVGDGSEGFSSQQGTTQEAPLNGNQDDPDDQGQSGSGTEYFLFYQKYFLQSFHLFLSIWQNFKLTWVEGFGFPLRAVCWKFESFLPTEPVEPGQICPNVLKFVLLSFHALGRASTSSAMLLHYFKRIQFIMKWTSFHSINLHQPHTRTCWFVGDGTCPHRIRTTAEHLDWFLIVL